MIRRLLLAGCFSAAFVLPSPALAAPGDKTTDPWGCEQYEVYQTGSRVVCEYFRDGPLASSMYKTMGKAMMRRGYWNQSETVQNLYHHFKIVMGLDNNWCNPTPLPSGGWTFIRLTTCLINKGIIPAGIPLGAKGYPRFDPRNTLRLGEKDPSRDCGSFAYRLGLTGGLIIPSYDLAVGMPLKFGGSYQYAQVAVYGPNSSSPNAPIFPRAAATTSEATVRRVIHLQNSKRSREHWVGILGPGGTSGSCIDTATVATANSTVYEQRHCTTWADHERTGVGLEADSPDPQYRHTECPAGDYGSSEFHFYGETPYSDHYHNCTWYAPRPDLTQTPDGYFINPEVTMFTGSATFTEKLRQLKRLDLLSCPINPDLVRQIVNHTMRKATESATPDKPVPPFEPVKIEDVDTDGAIVSDLEAPAQLPGTPPDLTQPSKTPAPPVVGRDPANPTPAPSNLSSDPVFNDPGTSAPELTMPTNIFDPIVNWLPDLPSITLPTQGSQCPTWAVNLTSVYNSPDWVWLLDGHCTLLEDQRSAIGALMIAMFGFGAALIILRA